MDVPEIALSDVAVVRDPLTAYGAARERAPLARLVAPGMPPMWALPLPMEVICELVGVPASDRPRWREYGAAVATGAGAEFAAAIPRIIEDAKEVVARRRAEPADDLVSDLVRAAESSDVELVTLVWHLVLAGQTPANLIGNALATLFERPETLARLRADPALMPRAEEELMRWCGPQLLTIPRHAREDVELYGVLIRRGEPVTAAIASANRDPRAFPDPKQNNGVREPAGRGGAQAEVRAVGEAEV